MKTKKLLLGIAFTILAFTSCTNDPEKVVASNDAIATQKIDDVVDDVIIIADDQFEVTEGSSATRTTSGGYHSVLPECAYVSDLGSTETLRHLTITFGTDNTTCTFRGRVLKGQIIIDRTKGNTFPKILTITFNNFYTNDKKIEGTISWSREMTGEGINIHPKTTVTTTNLKYITSKGTYTRNGIKTREMTAGFSTLSSPTDDVYTTYGTFTTTLPNGDVYTSLIEPETPLVRKTACSFMTPSIHSPVSGILKVSKNSHYVTLDFGNGDCDNLAMKSIDGSAAVEIVLED